LWDIFWFVVIVQFCFELNKSNDVQQSSVQHGLSYVNVYGST